MAGRKFARDFFLLNSKQPLLRQILRSQPAENNITRACMISANKHLSNRHYSVLSEFSKSIQHETSSNKEFQQSVKHLRDKAEQLKGGADELKARMQQTTEQMYKHVDGIYDEVGSSARKVSETIAEKLSATKEELIETLRKGKQESGTPNGSSKFSSTMHDTHSKNGSKIENSGDSQSGASAAAGAILNTFRSVISSASPTVSQGLQNVKNIKAFDLMEKGYKLVKDDLTGKTNRRRLKYASTEPFTGVPSTRTEVVIVQSKQSVFSRKWEALRQKVQNHPMLKKVEKMSEPVVNKSQEIAEEVVEIWDTTDNPVVHKIQDLNDKVFGENDAAMSLKEIHNRDPDFSLSEFVSEVEQVTKPVLNAYIKGDCEALKKYCTPQLIERCKAVNKVYEDHGIVLDNKILHISDVDISETKMMGDTPVILLTFQTQQVHCLRDKHGLITEGSKDTIQTVYYAWALQQMQPEEVGTDGIYYTWRLMDMQEHGVTALI